MGEIPEDIQQTARKIAFADGGEPGCHIEYMVASAILAERKRCAGVCKRHIKYPCVGKEDEIETGTAENILDAILNP